MRVVSTRDPRALYWVAERTNRPPTDWQQQFVAFCSMIDDSVRGIAYFDHYSGPDVQIHAAGSPGWLDRTFLAAIFSFAFQELGVCRVSAWIASSNEAAVDLALRLGFRLEATLKDAHPDGDLCIFVMRKSDCRWIPQE